MQQEPTEGSRPRTSRPRRIPRRRPRIALYSHDILGLGHLRRNLLIAQALSRSELAATCLLISGANETNFFSLPEGVDRLTLPRISKDLRGKYRSARLEMTVGELATLRQKLIRLALEQFEPDVLIVDFNPTGVCGELLPALESIEKHGRTRCVLGLREVLDDFDTVQSEWLSKRKVQVMERFYDAIWIYGDSQIFDPLREYGFPASIANKAHYTGYLDQSSRLNGTCESSRSGVNGDTPRQRKTVACVVGGGLDGARLIRTFIDAVPPDFDGMVLTGPYMPQSDLHVVRHAAASSPNIQILEFTPEADRLIAGADRVVGMAGYNTVCSILSFRKPALLVPRVTPRREQWIRADRLSKLNLVDVISPDELTPDHLAEWLRRPVTHLQSARYFVDLNGLDRIVAGIAALVLGDENPVPLAPATVLQPSAMDAPQ